MATDKGPAERLATKTLWTHALAANFLFLLEVLSRHRQDGRFDGAVVVGMGASIVILLVLILRVRSELSTEASLSLEERERLRSRILVFGPLGVLDALVVLRRKRLTSKD